MVSKDNTSKAGNTTKAEKSSGNGNAGMMESNEPGEVNFDTGPAATPQNTSKVKRPNFIKPPKRIDKAPVQPEPELVRIAKKRRNNDKSAKRPSDTTAAPELETEIPPASSAPANQNMPNAGTLMRDIRRRPSASPFFFAFLLSVLWLGLGAAYIWGYYGAKIIEAETFSILFNTPNAVTLLAAFVLPVPMIWLMAMMIRRSQELHLMANAMAKAALHLTMPEGLASEAISSIGQAIRREVAAMNEGVERALGRASELEALVHSEVTALERAYADSETRMRAMLESLYQERQSISAAGHSLGNELEPTIARIKEEGSSLHMLIEGATRNLHALDKRLTLHANGLNEAAELVANKTGETLNQMTAQANEMKNLAGGVLKDIQTTAGQFSQQADGLHSAAQSLKSANLEIDDVLKDRHDKLSSLAEILVRKSDEIDTLMHTYSNIVSDALSGAEERAREVGKQIAMNATQSSRTAISELEKLRSVAGQETALAVSGFQKNYEKVSRELSANLEDAGSRFSDTTSDLRKAVRHMSGELEKTRSDLKASIREMTNEMDKAREEINKTIFKLPEETTRNAEALRQAVMDEIGALDALNAMVLNKSGNDDTFQPPERSRENITKPISSLKAGSSLSGTDENDRKGGRFARKISAAISGDTPERSPSKWSLPDLLAAASGSEDDTGRLAAPPPTRPRQSESKEARLPPVMEDLPPLQETPRRAAEPEAGNIMQPVMNTEGPQPQDSSATLNSLSVDLSRALDHQAPAELWRRYRDGEPGVFTRRLYTMRGQRIFDEIASKYDREHEFREDVDRYIRDFENLLESAAESDRESMLIDTYLTSETGKVYLMLAHASGRLGDDR